MLVFGHFALRSQRETGKLALWPGNRAYFCVFRGIRQIGLSCLKNLVFVLKTQKAPDRTKCAKGPDRFRNKTDQTFFIENIARNGLKSHFLGPKSAPFCCKNANCQIVPVSCVYPPPPIPFCLRKSQNFSGVAPANQTKERAKTKSS